MNLIELVICGKNNAQILKCLLEIVHDAYPNDYELLEIYKKRNLIHFAIRFSTKEIFVILMDNLKNIVTKREIQEILKNKAYGKLNLLQSAAIFSLSIELHKVLWATYTEYFEKSEILNFIKNIDAYNNRLLFTAIFNNKNLEIVKLTWEQIKSFMTIDEQVKYLKSKGSNNLNIARLADKYSNLYIQNWVKDLLKQINLKSDIYSIIGWLYCVLVLILGVLCLFYVASLDENSLS